MPVSESTRRVMARLKEGRVLSIVSAPIRRLGDARSLILLSQMVYWTTRDRNVLNAQGWFSKPASEWIEETGLTRSYMASCLKTLQEHQVVKIWQRMPKTAPWFKLDLNRLHVLCQGSAPASEIALAQFIADAAFREGILGRPLPYYTLLSELVDDALLGLFLSRCVFWQEALEQRGRLNTRKRTWGWSSADWANDIGITRAQLRNLLKRASAHGLIEVTTADRPFPGIWVDFERIDKAIYMPVTECPIHTVDRAFRNNTKEEIPSDPASSKGKAATEATPEQPRSGQNSHIKPVNAQEEGNSHQPQSETAQSTRARGVDYVVDYPDYHSPCPDQAIDVGVVVSDLIYPPTDSTLETTGLQRTIASALPHRRQVLLDELAELMRRGTPRNPISYLRAMVKADNAAQGTLVLEYAHLTVMRREQANRDQQQREKSAPAPTGPEYAKDLDPKDHEKRMAFMRDWRKKSKAPEFTTSTVEETL